MSVLQRIVSFFTALVAMIMSVLGLTKGNASYQSYTNLTYGTHGLQLDLYVPDQDMLRSANGVLLYIHGGYWTSGNKTEGNDTCKAWAKKGYVTATLNYRFIGVGVSFNDELDDIDAALSFIKQKCADMDVSVTKAGLVGFSAGGHLALMYGYTRSGSAPLTISFVSSRSGPADLHYDKWTEVDEVSMTYFTMLSLGSGQLITPYSDAQTIENAALSVSPYTYVKKSSPATLLAYGTADLLVPQSSCTVLINALKKAGTSYEYINFPTSGHYLDNDPSSTSEYDETLGEFLSAHFGY